MARPGSTTTGILISLLALLLFDLMGLVIKLMSGSYAAAELSAYRNLFGLVPSIVVLWSSAEWRARGRRLRIRQWPLACLRGIIVTFAQFLFYLSLGRMAFATATTISYSMALFTTAFAVPLLGERVGIVRWLAVVIGFVGVVMVMQPDRGDFDVDALMPVGAAALYGLSGITVRLFDRDVSSALVNLYSSVFALAGSTVLCLTTTGFAPLADSRDLAWIVAMGGFGGFGVLCLTVSYRMTEPSNLAPFNYFGIPLAFVLGWLFFREAPFDRLFPGVILIVGGGMMIVWRERRLHRERLATARIEAAKRL